jgi:hypothetical protein
MTNTVGHPGHEVLANGHRPSDGEQREIPRDGVPLRRLLGLATLTPAQAAYVADEVLNALASRPGYGPLDASDVIINPDGAVRLAPRDRASTADAGPAAAALLEEIAHNADRPAAHRRPAGSALLAAVTRGAAQLAAGDDLRPAAELREAMDAAGATRAELAGQLAALVAVPLVRVPDVAADVGSGPGRLAPRSNGSTGRHATVPPPPPGPVIRPPVGPPGPRRRVAAAAVAVAVLAVAGAIAAFVVPRTGDRDRPAAPVHSAAPSITARPPAATGNAPTPRAVPELAPAAAGPIAAVRLHPTRPCRPGATCEVTVRIRLRPPSLSALTWHATAFDRCTGTRHRIDRGSMIAEPGWRSVYATVRMPLPRADSLAVVAVVDTPVSVASRPMLVPARGGSCPRG